VKWAVMHGAPGKILPRAANRSGPALMRTAYADVTGYCCIILQQQPQWDSMRQISISCQIQMTALCLGSQRPKDVYIKVIQMKNKHLISLLKG